MRWRPHPARLFPPVNRATGYQSRFSGHRGPGLCVRPGFSFSGESGTDYRGKTYAVGETALRNACLFAAAFIHVFFQAAHTLLINCEIKFSQGLDVAEKGAYNEFSAFGHRSLKRLSTLAA